jgi:GNAT superfamily N-acetyltransferase
MVWNASQKAPFDVCAASADPRSPKPRTLVTRLSETFRYALDIVRFRDPHRVALLAIREICRPLVYWYCWDIVENDLRLPFRVPYGTRRFTVRTHGGTHRIESTVAILLPLGELSSEEITARCKRGDVVGVAYAENEPVGYSWMTFDTGFEMAFGTRWFLRPNEAVLYGSYVVPQWRGNGVHSWLDLEMNNYARQRGITRTLGSISILNSGSLSLARKQGKPVIMTLLLIRLRGLGWTYRRAFGAPLTSHFE